MKKIYPLSFILVIATQLLVAQPKELTTNYFKNGKIHLVNSSHQDIAWVNSPDVCKYDRTHHIMLPLLKRMGENPNVRFSVESAMYLIEFLEQYPDKYDEVLKYTREGRLEWGATYSQPYQGLYDGEALLRQTYLGRKDLKKILPGCEFRAAWNVDVPGMSPQFPQILAKSGIPYYNISRFKTGFYEWFSPDGSSVKVISTGQYSGYSGQVLALPTEAEKTDALINIVNYWGDYQKQRKIAPAVLALLSQDCTLPVDFDNLINDWNTRKDKDVKALPFMQYSTSTMFFDHLTSNKNANFDKIVGARPDVWLYIHGPTHHRAVAAGRKASRNLTAAETFSTFYCLTANDFSSYPTERLHSSWRNAIYPDHGWGGYHGVITDRLFREKFESARDTSAVLLNEATTKLAAKIKYNKERLYAVTVFNPLSWERTDPVTFTLDAEGRAHNFLKIVDAEGNDVAFQFTDDHNYKGNRDEVLSLMFVADKVPSLGYKTFYVVESDKPTTVRNTTEFPVYENKYFKMCLGDGGIESLYDKELQAEVFNTTKFKGAEIFSVKSEGTGAGEFSDIQQVTLDGFDKLSNYKTPWICVESGAVRDVFQTSTQFKDTKANLRIAMYKDIKKIDVEVDLNGYVGENWREYRLAFPVAATQKDITYDMHFGAIEVGKDEMEGKAGNENLQPTYNVACTGVHPREVQDWFCASGNNQALTIASDVAIFDWIDPTNTSSDSYILQPVLLSSRKSCHGLGNYYLQPGNHSFRFSLYSHDGDWKHGYKSATQQNRELAVVVTAKEQMTGEALAESMSFAEVGGKNIVISTIKKCDDDNSTIIRCFDMERSNTIASFNLFVPVLGVEHTNLLEEPSKVLKSSAKSFEYPIGKSAIETFKIKTN